MGLRDIIRKMPTEKGELTDYLMKNNKDVRDLMDKNPDYKSALETAVNDSFDKYSPHFDKGVGNLVGKVGGAGHLVGYGADAWFVGTGDIVGSLGGKFLNLLAQIPEKMYGVYYGIKTGNYLDSLQNIIEGAVSYLPGLTFVDQGLKRIVQKRMVKDALNNFRKSTGTYKPWTTRIKDKLFGKYKGVEDRQKNVFTPKYEAAAA